ncbi:MAG: fumarylacetoacetate hydrolase family protein [Halobacteriales archaeon]|nr:fumarylacetoacetate hydrolase family protein [Halobacteriales archaeon]
MRRVRFRQSGEVVRTGEWTDRGIEAAGETFDPDAVTVLPPTEPSKVIGVSTNTEELLADPSRDIEPPARPKLFTKTPNTLVGHGGSVTLLPGEDLDYEGELAVVIGEQCRHVSRTDAMDVVAGFTCANDITTHTQRDPYGVRFKSVDNTCPVGPVVATPDEVPDDATIETRVNGETRQSHTRESLLFSIPEIIEEITTYLTLEAGDIVPTGASPEIGTLEAGDRVEVEVEGVGTLVHGVRAPGGD